MKTKCSFILKTSVALLLAILMVFGSVSTVIAAVVDVSTGDQSISTAAKKGLDIAGTAANADLASTGASTWTFYLAIKDPQNYYGGSSIKCNTNYKGDGEDWHQYDMTDTGKYWAGRSLYKVTFTDSYGGLGALQFQVYDGSTYKDQWQVWGIKNWHAYSTNYSGHVFVYDTQSYTDTYSTSNAKYGWTKGDYYLYNNITDSWYGVNNAPQMTVDSSDSSRRYYDFYLKQNEKSSTDYLLFRFWDASDEEQVGPAYQSTHRSSISGKTASSPATDVRNITKYDDKDTAWQYPTNGFTSGKYYRVRVYFDTDYNGTGGVWATNTALTNMDPTFSTTAFTKGTTYNLTNLVGVTSGSNVGTVSYSSYQYYDGSWHNISSPSSWKPTATNITKLRVTATDGGVKSTGDNDKRNAYSARTETKETNISVTATSYTITYPSDASYTIAGTKPGTAENGSTVSFKVTPSTGYRIDKVQYTPEGGSATNATAGSNNEYHFTMPDKNVTVSVTAVKQYTVTLTTSDTGFDSKKYKVGSGTQQTYSSAITVDSGSNVVFDVTYTTGYEYDSTSSLDGATASNSNKTFTLSNITANKTVNLKAKKITWSGLTAVGKYSTTAANDASYSNDFPTDTAPNVSIAATSATQLDGVAVSAPAADPTGYIFAGWYTANGSFANAENKDTTFKPNDANAVAIAKYKKLFTITSSVDSTGTGSGTVTTSKTSVEAGGSYTITATAKSGSAVESVKVNDTAKTASASQTISSVSADQTVVVKFAAKPHVIGKLAAAGWTKPGDAMTSNAAGTEFTYTRTELAAGTYDFQHYIGTGTGGTYDNASTDIATKTISGGATLSSVDNGYGGKKFQLVLTAKSDVTLVSNGSKFTAITVRKSGGAKYDVTFKKADNTTINGTYLGTPFTTASADAVVQVYDGDEISFTVTAASGYHIDSLTSGTTPAFSPAVTKEYKLSNVTAAKTITPTAKADVNITAKTNKSSRGTVTVDKNKSFKGDTVKITVTPLAGSLKSLTATYSGSGKTYEYKNSNWTEVQSTTGSSTNNALLGAFLSSAKDKFALAPTGAETDEAAIAALPDLAPVGAAQTINMVMQEDSAVTINAVFDTYSADSTWYYNGYDTSGNAVSGYHSKQMTESMVSGEKFSYYHVEGRTGNDQLMTVSNGAASSGTRYVYFTASAEGGWSTDENHQYAYFYNNSGDAGNAWPGYKMTKYTTNDYGQNVYRVEIPTSSSPTGVIFNNASNAAHQTTNVTDLSKGGYYLLNTSHWDDNLKKTIHDWQSYDCSYPNAGYSTGTEYFYQYSTYNGDYTGDFNTKGFYNHYTASKEFAKPKELGTNTGDYYINVLYPNTTYTINGVAKKTGTNPMIIWSAEPLAGDDENVTVYAKDGAIRGETFGSTYANIADTKIYAANGTTTVGTKRNGSITNQTYETYKAAKGDTLVIKTQIGATDTGNLSNAADLKAKYYVRGFCVNGEVSELLEWNADGLYTLTYKIPEDTEITKFEITPIYYLKDTTANPIVTYRVTGFTDELKAVGAGKPGWGDTLYTYPYYGKLGGDSNAFGAYPGQPMVYYKGQYQMQIPQKSTTWVNNTSSNTTVSGVTMSNGYWDSVHKMIQGYGDNSTSADHVQTYDYGDFYKIFNEKKPVDNIVFDFKYRTKKHNFENQPGTTITKDNLDSNYGTNGNGFELLTNFHGRNVDLFGTPLSGDQLNATPVYVLSIGGVNETAHTGVENIAGYYATEWMVYGSSNGSSYNRISAGGKNSIPPEVLVLNDDDNTSFNNTTYPSADANHTLTQWKELYTALEEYRGKPVMISYEAADAQQSQGMYYTGTGGATRNDGRWLYSKTGENITSTIKIQYSDDNGVTYHDLDKTTPQVNGLSAYFTNDGVEGQMTYSTTIDPDKTFDFEAKTTNGNYKFVGWYMEDGTKITSDNASYTERSGSYTFVAKFMQVQSGQLILSHSADKGTIGGTDYQGAGTAKISAVVKDGDEVIRTYDLSTSDITLDDKIIKSDSTYTIDVTLEATATGSDVLGPTVLANPSGQDATYFNAASTTTEGKTKTIVLNSFTVASLFSGSTQSVKNIIYHSYFTQSVFNYTLTFQYTDRFNADKSFTRQGQLTSAQVANDNYVEKDGNNFNLLPAFIQTVAPYESNFGEDITWNISKAAFTQNGSTYSCTATINSSQTKETKVNVTFKLPYEHTNGIATVNGDKVGTAATTTDFALTGNNAVKFDTIPVLPDNGVNGIYTEDTWKNWIAAPKTITDGSDTLYFQYWSVKKTTAAGENDPELARCYFQGFNFVALDNYTITPIYDTQSTDISQSSIYTGASYLETSRNQWNDDKDRTKAEKDKAADLLYNDFVLNYNYKGVDIYKGDSDSDDIKDLGVVVERVKELDINQDGSKNTNIANYTSVAENLDTVRGVINGTTTNSKFIKDSIAKTALDNKNRILFYEAFYNGAGWSVDKQTSVAKYAYKNYVYRAYTYIKYKDAQGNDQIKLSVPAYFTMYDEATANYKASTSTTSGN